MGPVLAALLFLGPTCLAAGASPAADKLVPLFTIQRTETANELNSEARHTAEGFPRKDPINIYWLMKAKDGHREKLTAIEKQKTYGISVEKGSDSEVVFTLRAFKGRKLIVRRTGTTGDFGAKVFTQINDEEHELERLFITTLPSKGLLPVVSKVEIFGRAKPDGSVEKEIFIP